MEIDLLIIFFFFKGKKKSIIVSVKNKIPKRFFVFFFSRMHVLFLTVVKKCLEKKKSYGSLLCSIIVFRSRLY